MSVRTRSFIVNNEQIGQSTLWQLYSSGAAMAVIRLYTKDVNTDWLKDDIKKTYDSNLDKLNGDGTFNLTWSYDITTFTKGYPVYVSYCFIVNNEVCAVGSGDTFDCYLVSHNIIISSFDCFVNAFYDIFTKKFCKCKQYVNHFLL